MPNLSVDGKCRIAEQVTDIIVSNFDVENIFPEEELQQWAKDNGYYEMDNSAVAAKWLSDYADDYGYFEAE